MNLLEAIEMYAQSTTPKAIANLKSTIKFYILPGFHTIKNKSFSVEKWMCKLPLTDFLSRAKPVFETEYAAALAHKNEGTLKNNRSNLNQFLLWIEAQDWYPEIEHSLQVQDMPQKSPIIGRLRPTLTSLRHGRRQANASPYALKQEELTPVLTQQIAELHTYLTSPYMPARRGDRSIRETSWNSYYARIQAFLGWLKSARNWSVDDLNITLMADPGLLQEHFIWLFTERKAGYRVAQLTCCAALNIAKWHYGKHSKLARFVDCPEVLAIRSISNELAPMEKNDRRYTSPEALSERLLDFEKCQEVVKYLRLCCAEHNRSYKKRSSDAVINSWQNYLLIAILTYTPVRQREIRELEIGRNLIREDDGWWVKLTAAQHKTGSITGKGREYPLFAGSSKAQLTKDLDTFVNEIRPRANLQHNFLFFMRGTNKDKRQKGRPIKDTVHLRWVVRNQVHKVSTLLYGPENAKAPTPHDFRRIFVTWLHTYGTMEEQALYAEVLGHSVQEASRTYSMLSSRDKTERADDAFRAVAERAQRMKAQKKERELL